MASAHNLTPTPQGFLRGEMLNDSNYTAAGQPHLSSLSYLLLAIVPVITIFGNALVILSIFKEKRLYRHHTNHFIASLAASDLMMNGDQWIIGQVLCKLFLAVDVAGCTASILHLVLISVDRYLAVMYPTTYRYKIREGKIGILIFAVWAISIAIAVPMLFGDGYKEATHSCDLLSPHYMIYSSIISFYIPAIILTGTYVKIFRKIRQHSETNARWQATHRRKGGLPGIPVAVPIDNILEDGDVIEQNANLNASVLHRMATKSLSFPVPERRDKLQKRNFVNKSAVGFSADYDYSDNSDSDNHTSPVAKVHHSRSEPENHKLLANNSHKHNGNNNNNNNNNNETNAEEHSDSDSQKSPTAQTLSAAETASRMFKKLADATSVLQNQTRNATISKEHKATNLVAIILGTFIICWLPFFSLTLIFGIYWEVEKGGVIGQVPTAAFFWATWSGYVNSGVNPILYTLFNELYRKTFIRILRCSSQL